MSGMKDRARRTLSDSNGGIGLAAALVMPLVIMSLGLGIDYGYLTVQKRELQGIADLTAIVASSQLSESTTAARNHFKRNGLNFLIATPNGLMDVDGHTVAQSKNAMRDGIVTITPGRYVADPAIAAAQRFVANATPPDAVQVSIEKEGMLQVAAMFADPPTMSAVGTAASQKLASFSIGSRLASLNDGILNAVLGQMLGANLSLKVMDYRSLLDADLDVQPFLKAAALQLNLTAASYEDVLTADITIPQLFAALRKTGGLPAAVTTVLNTLEKAVSKNKKTLTLAEILKLDPKKRLKVDAGQNLDMQLSVFDVVSAAAGIANGSNQIALDTAVNLPGLASVKIKLAVGEPPVESPAHRLGTTGATVQTAQTRLSITMSVDGLTALLGLKVNLPIYVEVAHAEAQLADIRCHGGSPSNASVSVDTIPGVAELAIGTVDASGFSSFATKPTVQTAHLLNVLIVKVDGKAHVEAKNLKPERLTFSPSEVAANGVKTVSTKNLLTSATQSLLNNLELDVNIPLISVLTDTIVKTAMVKTLGAVTPAVDTVLYNLLLLVGVRIGEADVRVTGASCQQPVLVQ